MLINYKDFIVFSNTRTLFKSFYFIKSEFCSLTPICYTKLNINDNDNQLITNKTNRNFDSDDKTEPTTEKKTRNYYTWSEEDEQKLFDAVKDHGTNWEYISRECFQSIRTPGSIEKKWYLLNQKVKRTSYHNPWTPEEDNILKEGVSRYGAGQWSAISKLLPQKDAAQLFNRWNIIVKSKRGKWTEEEHKLLIQLVNKYGRKWAIISNIMNRPNSYIQNYYDSHVLNSKWSTEDKKLLYKALKEHGENWDEVIKYFPNRTLANVKSQFITVPSCNPKVNSGRWNDKEKQAFTEAFERYGKKWKLISEHVGCRSPIQCHQYWRNNFKDEQTI